MGSNSSSTFSYATLIERFYFNPSKQDCSVFIYGGCGGNGNNFVSKRECLDFCRKRKKATLAGDKKSNRVRVVVVDFSLKFQPRVFNNQ